MRTLGWSLASLIAVGPLLAQQPAAKQNSPVAPAPPPPAAPPPRVVLFDPQTNPLDKVLFDWEQKMKSVQTLFAEVVRTETDSVTGTKEVYAGYVKLMRPNRADLYLAKQNSAKPDVYDRFLCTGTYLYEFRPQQKLIRVHTLPQKAPGQAAVDDGFLSFLFGLEAKELKKRYDISMMKPSDQWYAYLHVKPVATSDKAEFSEARLAILLQSMLPREMIFVPPNGNQVNWKIGANDPNKTVGPADFQAPQLPRDWQLQQLPAVRAAVPQQPQPGPAALPPSKVRPAGN
ncbi:MAG: TIGR03009 domain-containing protein [Gemmataceae bacterium]